jgi:2-(1,2-epoxy-1,2-dihydrophenyl)acetyl-CoA isomerase
MTGYRHLALSTDGPVAVLLLNRPAALNALTHEMRLELRDALEWLAANDAIRAVVLGGQGRAFCAGADLKEAGSRGVEQELLDEYQPCFNAIGAMAKPVIAAVTGSASGIGLSLALHCDLMIMTEDAFLCAAFGGIGLVPDGGASWLLVRQVGYRRAFQLAVEAERIPARRALELGLTNKVVPAEALMGQAHDWASQLATQSPLALAGTKKLMRLAMTAEFNEVFHSEAAFQERCAQSGYFQERLEAFRQRIRASGDVPARCAADDEVT